MRINTSTWRRSRPRVTSRAPSVRLASLSLTSSLSLTRLSLTSSLTRQSHLASRRGLPLAYLAQLGSVERRPKRPRKRPDVVHSFVRSSNPYAERHGNRARVADKGSAKRKRRSAIKAGQTGSIVVPVLSSGSARKAGSFATPR